jgi:hypothetical protein
MSLPHKRTRGVALLVAGVVAGLLLVSPASAHFTDDLQHLTKHVWRSIKPKVYTRTEVDALPGLVRAFGHVADDGSLDRSRDTHGIVGSRRDGSYTCVQLDPSIDATRAVPIVTLDMNDNFRFTLPGTIGWVAVLGVCTGGTNEVRVATGSYGADVNSGAPVVGPTSFYILVP